MEYNNIAWQTPLGMGIGSTLDLGEKNIIFCIISFCLYSFVPCSKLYDAVFGL